MTLKGQVETLLEDQERDKRSGRTESLLREVMKYTQHGPPRGILVLGHTDDFAVRHLLPRFVGMCEKEGILSELRNSRTISVGRCFGGKCSVIFDGEVHYSFNGTIFEDHYRFETRLRTFLARVQ